MRIGPWLTFSVKILSRRPTRSLISLMGLVLGSATIISMSAVSARMRKDALAEIEAMGSRLIIINAGRPINVYLRGQRAGVAPTLTLDDLSSLLQTFPEIERAAPASTELRRVKYRDHFVSVPVVGTTPEFLHVRNFALAHGRFFTEQENQVRRRVAVVGHSVARELAGGADFLGQKLSIQGIPFQVIGVLRRKGTIALGTDEDSQVFVPLNTAMSRMFNVDYLNSILLTVFSGIDCAALVERLRRTLRERHRIRPEGREDFSVLDPTQLLETLSRSRHFFDRLGMAIAVLCFFFGGLGVMAIMSLSVRERCHEIAVRRAVGATKCQIAAQFLMEAALLSLTGGWLGVSLGLWATAAGQYFMTEPLPMPGKWAALSWLFALSTGLVFSFLPIRKALRVSPIEAFRHTAYRGV